MAIIGLLAAIILPALPRATSRARLEAYAVDAAGLLKADRNAAVRRRIQVRTQVDAPARLIASGVTGRELRFPDDIVVDTALASRCGDQPAGSAIIFFASGMSCGGVIAMSRPGTGYQVRVSWLTGGIEVVPITPP
jgi:general secretion pathway protein H